MRSSNFLIAFIFFTFILSCKKTDLPLEGRNATIASAMKIQSSQTVLSSGSCIEDVDEGLGYDTVLRPTILGYHLINHPYSLAIMQQAYTNLYGTANGVSITHKYVRFKPSSPAQLSTLVDLDIDLFDHPLDYEITQQGDYYSDGITPAEEIPWLYAVVDVNFNPPSGITYEVLEQIHIPTIAAVENEAFMLTGNPYDDPECYSSGGESLLENDQNNIEPCYEQLCPPEYTWDPGSCQCVPTTNCPLGFHWDGTQCVPDGPPPPNPGKQPSGTITVTDNNDGGNVLRPVRNARVIARRFLKVERTFTNNNGQFFLSKEFNKVHLFAEFENTQSSIRVLRRARLWQMLNPVRRDFGKFKGSLNNRQLNIAYDGNALSRLARYWAAATANNTVQEYRDFANQQGIGNPPDNMKILLTNWQMQGVSGAAPMFAKRVLGVPADFVTTFLINNLGGVQGGMAALLMYLEAQVDITGGYNRNGTTSMSDQMSELMFHEQTHAAHYNKVGNAWWTSFLNAELSEMMLGPSPYGNGQRANSPIIALGESWAYHVGHFATDWKYGQTGLAFEQGIIYDNGVLSDQGVLVFTGLNAHLNLLEDFSRDRTNDVFNWIPQGLYYDLIDNRNDQSFGRVNLNDVVTGYTNLQFFNALDADVNTLQDYRVRLLNENGNNQAAGVTTIFTFYGY